MKNIQRSLRGALLAGPALLLLACGDSLTNPRLQSFMGCDVEEIFVDDVRTGTLSSGDCTVQGAYAEMWLLDLRDDRNVIIDMESLDFDTYLVLYDRDTGQVLDENDDNFDTDSRLAVFLQRGRYIISATSFDVGETGQYRLTVD